MIVCAGEALIDMLPRTMASGEDVYLPVPGGAVFNTAIACGRLGHPTAFVCGLSGDMMGDRLREALAASNVDASLSPSLDAPTTLAFVKLTHGQAEYAFYDENTALRRMGVGDLPTLPAGTQALHVGAISLIGEPAGGAFETLAMRAVEAGAVLSFDPNIRPGFIRDAAAHRARCLRLAQAAHILKVSDEDLDWLAEGIDGAGEALLARWRADGPTLLLVTRGANGVSAITRTGSFDVPAVPVEVVDTVGAGDTFNAGLLVGLARAGLLSPNALGAAGAQDLRPAVELGVRAAAVTVSRAGANPPTAAQLGLADA